MSMKMTLWESELSGTLCIWLPIASKLPNVKNCATVILLDDSFTNISSLVDLLFPLNSLATFRMAWTSIVQMERQ